MSGHDYFRLQRDQGIESFYPCRNQAIDSKRCYSYEADVARQEHVRLREPHRDVGRCMCRSKDMQFSTTEQRHIILQRLRDDQFEAGEATSKLLHQTIVNMRWKPQLLDCTDGSRMGQDASICKDLVSPHVIDVMVGIEHHGDLCSLM